MLYPPVHPLRGDASFDWTGHLICDNHCTSDQLADFFQLCFKQPSPEGHYGNSTCAMKQMIKGWYDQAVLMDSICADTGSLSLPPPLKQKIWSEEQNLILNVKFLETVIRSVFSSTSYFFSVSYSPLDFRSIKHFSWCFVLPKVQFATFLLAMLLTWFQLLLSLIRTEVFQLRKGLPVTHLSRSQNRGVLGWT